MSYNNYDCMEYFGFVASMEFIKSPRYSVLSIFYFVKTMSIVSLLLHKCNRISNLYLI